MKWIIKIAAYLLTGIITVLLLLIILIASGTLNSKISSITSKVVNNVINGEISIGKLEGNLLSDFSISDISITMNEKEILKVNELAIKYTPLAIAKKTIEAKLFHINGLHLSVTEDSTGKWDFLKLMPPSDTVKKEDESKPMLWKINMHDIKLNNIVAYITTKEDDNTIPKKVSLDASANFRYSKDILYAKLLNFKLSTENPQILITKMNIETDLSDSVLTWKNFELQMPGTYLVSDGKIPINKPEFSKIELNISPLSFEDIKGWVKGVYGTPDIELNITENEDGNERGGDINFSLKENDQSLIVDGNIWEVNNNTDYKFFINVNNIDGSHWTNNSGLKSNISGTLQIEGTGLEIKENVIRANANFKNIIFENYKIDNLSLDVDKNRERIDGIIMAATPYGILSATTYLNGRNYQIKAFKFQNSGLDLGITGEGMLKGRHNLNLILNVNNIDTSSNIIFIPDSITINGQLNASLDGTTDTMNLNARLLVDTINWNSLSAQNLITNMTSEFSLSGLIDEQSGITNDNPYDNLLKGLSLKADIQSDVISFNEYKIDSSGINLKMESEKLFGGLILNSSYGNIESDFEFSELFKLPVYQLNASIKNADLSNIASNPALTGNMNFDISAKGTGITPGNSALEVIMRSTESSVMNHKLENFTSVLNINNDHYQLEGMSLETPFILFNLSGKGSWKENNGLYFFLRAKDISLLAPVTKLEPLNLEGELNGEITGPSDSLNIKVNMAFQELKAGDINAETINADGNLYLKNDSLNGMVKLEIDNSELNDFKLEKFFFETILNNNKIDNHIGFYVTDSLNGFVKTALIFSKNPTLNLNELYFQIRDNKWLNTKDSSYITFFKDSLLFNNIAITSKNSFMKIDGVLASKGEENLNFEARGIKLIKIPGLQLIPFPVSGTITSKLNISGTAKTPSFILNASADQLIMDTIKFNKINIDAGYEDEKLSFNSTVEDQNKILLEAKGILPVLISFEDKKYEITESGELYVNSNINNFDLGRLNQFIPLTGTGINGLFSMGTEVSNTPYKPNLKGFAHIDRGRLRYDRYGIDYRDINLRSRLTKNIIILDTLKLQSGKGSLDIKGELETDTLYKGQLKTFQLNIRGNKFRLFNSDLLRAVINTNINLAGTPEKPVLSGKLTITEANLNTDMFLKEFGSVSDDLEEPLLVEAREAAERKNLHQATLQHDNDSLSMDILKNLSGQFDVEIPGNTWIKGKNMNFEINGLVKAVIEKSQIDLFGSVNVKRGYYKLYGKRLDFEEGEVTLTGGREIDPQLNFNIAYRFRDVENILRKLNITVTGRVSNPQLAFLLDGAPIQEKDAVSYLLFNKSSNQLDSQENSSIKGGNLDIARDLALGQLSNVVKDALQSSLGLDVIEISGEDGWAQGSLSIGKYITNNLFLSYQRTFALDKKNKQIEPEKISLEYQLLKTLFLQATNQGANSGFDFILKWNWK